MSPALTQSVKVAFNVDRHTDGNVLQLIEPTGQYRQSSLKANAFECCLSGCMAARVVLQMLLSCPNARKNDIMVISS